MMEKYFEIFTNVFLILIFFPIWPFFPFQGEKNSVLGLLPQDREDTTRKNFKKYQLLHSKFQNVFSNSKETQQFGKEGFWVAW